MPPSRGDNDDPKRPAADCHGGFTVLPSNTDPHDLKFGPRNIFTVSIVSKNECCCFCLREVRKCSDMSGEAGQSGALNPTDREQQPGKKKARSREPSSWMSCKNSKSKCGRERKRCQSCEKQYRSSLFSRFSSKGRSQSTHSTRSSNDKETTTTRNTKKSYTLEMQSRLDRLENLVMLLQERYRTKAQHSGQPIESPTSSSNLQYDYDTPMQSIETDEAMEESQAMVQAEPRDLAQGSNEKATDNVAATTSWKEIVGIN